MLSREVMSKLDNPFRHSGMLLAGDSVTFDPGNSKVSGARPKACRDDVELLSIIWADMVAHLLCL